MAEPAELQGITVTASRSDGELTLASYQNFDIKSISIVTKNDAAVDVRLQIVDFELYFDIFSQCSSGRMVLTDGNDIISGYIDRLGGASTQPLTGLELVIVQLEVKVDNESPYTIDLQYRLDKIHDIVPMTNGSQIYTIHFVSTAKVQSLIKKVSKSFKSVAYHDAVKEIFNENLLNLKLIETDKTSGTHDFIIPNLRPLQAISWICSKSHDGPNNTCYFFFETQNGFKFKSLQQMYQQEPKYKDPYTFGAKLYKTDADDRKPQFEIIDYKTKEFDMQSALISGGIASKMIGVDIFNQTTNVYEENFEKNISKTLNKFSPYEDRDDIFTSYETFTLVSHEILDQSTAKDNDVKYMLNRAQAMAMMRHFSIRISVPGNWNLAPGDIVEVRYPKHKVPEHQQSVLENPMRTGKFLVTAVSHKLLDGKMISTLELSSDSLASRPKATYLLGGGTLAPIEVNESDNPIKIEEPSNIPVTNIPNFT